MSLWGIMALQNNMTGCDNIVMGNSAMCTAGATSGSNNVALGYVKRFDNNDNWGRQYRSGVERASGNNTTGCFNVALGYYALHTQYNWVTTMSLWG